VPAITDVHIENQLTESMPCGRRKSWHGYEVTGVNTFTVRLLSC